jgi:tripartite-type tricarboxylate transporter receptor subunit TctC
MRRSVLKAVLAALACAALPAAAQQWPQKPVKVVIGFTAGGTTDVVGRIVMQKLGDLWGQPVVVENRAGASGMIAAEAVAKAAPDGYTLLVSPQTSLAVAPALYGKAPYDTLRDFTPITLIGSTPTIMVANPGFAAKTFAEWVELAKKANPPLVYGSGGVGSSPHMAGELLSSALNVKQTHVPYKGENPGITDTIGGQVPIMFGNISAVVNHIKAGRLRALANTGAARSPLLPDVPTVSESGIRDFSIATWFGLLGPAGMPAEVASRIQADVVKVLAMPEVKAKLTDLGVDLSGMKPAEFSAFLRSEMTRYAKVIQDNNIKPD